MRACRTVRACWRVLARAAKGLLDEADEWRAEHGDPSGWGG